jgi:adenine deaminase
VPANSHPSWSAPSISREELLAVARGDEPADTLLTDARLINVFTGEIELTEIAIAGGRVAGIGPGYEARERIDLGGRYVVPGLIDAHVHIESSLVRPAEFARAVVPRGVTTVVTDPHEIAHVLGLDGIRFMLRDSENVPLSVLVNASSCVPATDLATAGAALEADDLAELLCEDRLLGLAEVMNFPGVIAGAPPVMAKLDAFAGRIIDGHAPGVTGKALNAYVSSGISSDHEATTLDEAREKVRLGMTVFLREATNAHNLSTLLPIVDRWTEPHLAFATDDRVPADLLDQGSVDHMVRMAINQGVHPISAIRIATLNPARHYRLSDRGAVAPGRRADLVVISDPEHFEAEEVWVAGRKVAEGGRPLFEAPAVDGSAVGGTVRLASAGASGKAAELDFSIPLPAGAGDKPTVRVIRAIPDQLLTEHLELPARVEGGHAVADPERDLAKIAVVERHTGSGRIGKGFVTGVGLREGALAGTFAHDHHNLVVIGVDDASMRAAARAVAEAGGGLAAANRGEVVALLPLPIAGLMSAEPVERVREGMDELLATAKALGSKLHDPFMAMSFLTLEVIPALKITDLGLVDVERFERVELFV